MVGFPLGANLSLVKAFEAKQAILQGADEIDMVINIGAAKLAYGMKYLMTSSKWLKQPMALL